MRGLRMTRVLPSPTNHPSGSNFASLKALTQVKARNFQAIRRCQRAVHFEARWDPASWLYAGNSEIPW